MGRVQKNAIKFKSLVPLAMSVFSLLSCSCNPASSTSIAAVPFQNGLVIVADKLMVASDGEELVGSKIHLAGKWCAIASTGKVVSQLCLNEQIVFFDVNKIVIDYIRSDVHDLDSILLHDKALANLLLNAYKELLANRPKDKIMFFAEGNHADTTVVFKYNLKSKKFEGLILTVLLYPAGKDNIVVHAQHLEDSNFASSKVFLAGADPTLVDKALPPYEFLKKEEWAIRTSYNPLPKREISLGEAVSSACKFVEAIHNVHPKLVGDSVDVLVIKPEGQEWYVQNRKILDVVELAFFDRKSFSFPIKYWFYLFCFLLLAVTFIISNKILQKNNFNSKELRKYIFITFGSTGTKRQSKKEKSKR